VSLAGDVAFWVGGPIANAAKAGTKLRLVAAGIEGGIGATRGIQGYYALQAGDNQAAAGYFGEAALRMFGMTTATTSALKASRNAASGTVEVTGQIARIWNNSRWFLNWLRGTRSLSRVATPLSHAEAKQIIANANRLGIVVDLNSAGLKGLEVTGQWAKIPHFKVGNIHIPVQPGFIP